nr:putative replication associated protein [Crucivirus sp.]
MSEPKQAAAAKHWCFTLNDADDNLDYTDVIEIWGQHADYLVFQEEKGDEDTKHYQGYLEFKKPMRLTAIVNLTKMFKPHWEKRKGTRDQARDYCMKEDTRVSGPWEHGIWNGAAQGKRSDLIEVATAIRERKTQREIFEEFPGSTLRYYSNIEKCRNLYRPVRTVPLQVYLLYGKPGSGKTQLFWETCPDGWDIPLGKDLWFTGYNGEDNVLIDDFAGNIGLTQLLRLLDKYPISCPSKGSHVWWCPKTITITTNLHPWEWYDYSTRTDSYQALKRRVHFVNRHKKEIINGEEVYSFEELEVEDFFENQKVERAVKEHAAKLWAQYK